MKRMLAIVVVVIALPGCKKDAPNAPIDQIWASRCATCHGDGSGNGEAAARLDPKPRDLRDAVWQSARDDATIGKAIIEGGAAVGRSPLMPPHFDLADRRDELVSFVRSLARTATPTSN